MFLFQKPESKQLADAVKNGNIKNVQKILNKATSDVVNFKNKYGNTALITAALDNHLEIVRILLAHPDVDVNLQADNSGNSTALIVASMRGNTEIVKLLLAVPGILVNVQTKTDEHSALSMGVMFGHAEVVKLLVDCPAVDVNLKGRYHCTALMQAANEGKEELVKLLLACPRVDVHFRNRNGYTAHTWASDKGIKDVIQAHIDALVPQKTGEPGIYDISVIDSNVQETSTIDVTGCTEDALEQQYSFASNDAHTVPATESESGHLRLSPVQDVSPSSPPDETLFETFKDVSVTEPSRSPQTNEESLEVTAQDRAALDTSC